MVTINLTNHLYVSDHYEVFYTVDADPQEFQTQITAVEGSLTESQLQQNLMDAYLLKESGINFVNVVAVPAVTPSPTAAQIAISAKQAEVDAALSARNTADVKTKKAEEIALRIGRTETYITDAAALTTMKDDLKLYTTTAANEYKAANDSYDSLRAELDALINV